MLMIAFGIIIVIGLLLFLRALVSLNEKVRKVYLSIKQKIFYNSLCRYFLTSTLKLHIASTDSLLAVYVLSKSVPDYNVNWSQILIPFGVLSALNITPLLYFYILRNRRSELATEEFKNKFGTLYLDLDPNKGQVEWSSLTFAIRRLFFVLLCYTLQEFPGI